MICVCGELRRHCRRGVDYDVIHNITKVDKWFIDKFAIITEMETALKTQELTPLNF